MNFLLLEEDELHPASGRATITGRRREHAREILGASKGDMLRVGLIGGELGLGRIVDLSDTKLELDVRLDRTPPAKRPLTLVMALPRPPVFRRLLSTVASLGVARLLVVGTARTEKSFWQSHATEPAAVRERLLLGLEQSGDTVLPEVEFHRYFETLTRDVLPAIVKDSRAFLAHPSAAAACPFDVSGPVTLFVGPEGGVVDFEVEKLCDVGFESVHLGPRILRVEPVVPLLIGRLCGEPASRA